MFWNGWIVVYKTQISLSFWVDPKEFISQKSMKKQGGYPLRTIAALPFLSLKMTLHKMFLKTEWT